MVISSGNDNSSKSTKRGTAEEALKARGRRQDGVVETGIGGDVRPIVSCVTRDRDKVDATSCLFLFNGVNLHYVILYFLSRQRSMQKYREILPCLVSSIDAYRESSQPPTSRYRIDQKNVNLP